ncbi:MAG: hypothetical protein ACRDRN_23010 [Sciscionella sp.]
MDPSQASEGSVRPPELPELIASRVLAHPAVDRLDRGQHGVIATPLPGRTVTGIRVAHAGDAVELAVVLRLGRPLRDTVSELRTLVRELAGEVTVNVTVSDVAPDVGSGDR